MVGSEGVPRRADPLGHTFSTTIPDCESDTIFQIIPVKHDLFGVGSQAVDPKAVQERDLMDVLIETLHRKSSCMRKQIAALNQFRGEYLKQSKRLRRAEVRPSRREIEALGGDQSEQGREDIPGAGTNRSRAKRTYRPKRSVYIFGIMETP
eukprot:1182102-Prorocentrum_minimum.AAC.1